MAAEALDIEVLGIDLLVPDAPTALEVRELCVLALASAGIEEGHMAVQFVDAERIHDLNPRRRGSVLEVTAPSVLHLGTTRDDAPVFPQIGVVEWRLDQDRITPWFRAPTNLDERDTSEIPAMTARIQKLAQRLERTGSAQ